MTNGTNDIATVIVGITCAAFLAYTITYALRSHFWQSPLGWVMFMLGVDGSVITGHVVVRRIFGDYAGYAQVAVGIYSFTALVAISLFVIMMIETRNKPLIVIPLKTERKVNS